MISDHFYKREYLMLTIDETNIDSIISKYHHDLPAELFQMNREKQILYLNKPRDFILESIETSLCF